jgi:hypothetical protein
VPPPSASRLTWLGINYDKAEEHEQYFCCAYLVAKQMSYQADSPGPTGRQLLLQQLAAAAAANNY